MPLRHKELETGLILNLSGKDQSLTDADHALLRRARVVRVDPSDSCNAACVFCESSFNARGARLPLAVFEEALPSIAKSPHLATIQFGCTYEPTIRKDFSAFGRALEASGVGRLAAEVMIVSNCWLLHRHDVRPFVAAGLNKLHVSLHSHEREEFIAVMGRDDLPQVSENLKRFKGEHPHVPISAVCVVNTLNAGAPMDFARWAFFDIGVDYLRFTRANIVGNVVNSPAKAALDKLPLGSGFQLTDEAWREFTAKLGGVASIGLDCLESTQHLKNSAISVDALRLKRKGAPMEHVAIRQARLERVGA
jgi:hypothetical protein